MHHIYTSTITERDLTTTDSWHHIPYKKRSYYHATYHQSKNQKPRAMDMPRTLLTYEDETYRVQLPAREHIDKDPKYSRKYDNPHGSWKSEKKNRRQWMKHKPSHKDTVAYPQRIVERMYETGQALHHSC